jgi:hypothetical protein
MSAQTSEQLQPIAQTFMVNHSSGIYVTKVGLFFASKADNSDYPVQVHIRPTVNGVPDSYKILENSIVFKSPSAITTSTNATSETIFQFEEPVYLEGNKEYAICITTNAKSNTYQIYSSKLGEFALGSTTSRIQKDPYSGVFFKSSNGRTFEADNTRDLTFKLYRANFLYENAIARFNAAPPPLKLLPTDPFKFTASDATLRVFHSNHGFQINDTVRISTDSSGFDSASTINGVFGSSILGSRVITAVDQTGYTFEMDSTADSSIFAGGEGILATQQYILDVFKPNIEILQPTGSTYSMYSTLTSSKSYAGDETAYGTIGPIPTPNKEDTFLRNPAVITTEAKETTLGRNAFTLEVELNSTSTYAVPSVDLQRASIITIHNIIDNQDSTATSGFNVPIGFVNETVAGFGSASAKHITVPFVLPDPATGIKVLVDVNRPSGTNFDLYYRTLPTGADTVIEDVDWTLASKVEPSSNHNNLPTDNNATLFREYRYTIGGDYVGQLIPFSTYQIKIVMRSTSSTNIPRFKALRTIALGT